MAVLHLQSGSVDHLVGLLFPPLLVDDGEGTIPVHDHQIPGSVPHRPDGVELHGTRKFILEGGLFRQTGCRPPDVEGPHGKLRPRFADRLGGQHAHGLAELDHPTGRQVPAIAHDTHPSPGLTGEDRSNLHSVDTRFFDPRRQRFGNFRIGVEDGFTREGIGHIVQCHPTQNPIPERLDNFSRLHQGGHPDPVGGPTIPLVDENILGDIHQPPCQISRVGGLQRRIGQPLPGSMGGDEVLEHRQALPEVTGDRGFDDLSRGLRHETPHPGQLPDLLLAASCSGIGHHEDRVELAIFRPLDLSEELLRDPLGHLGPNIDDLVVAFSLGDQTV